MKVLVIIPAAGLGTRMATPSRPQDAKGAPPSKQFAELGGVPILVRTLRKFLRSPQVHEIYIALRTPEPEQFPPVLERELISAREHWSEDWGPGKLVRIVEGGEHRQQSVANALAKINAVDDDIVLVHDAVRPFVDADIIRSVIAAAAKHGAAIAGLPAVDTVKQVDRTADGAIVTSTVPRERVVLAQTPQGFRFAVLKKAFD
ncbi:MAG: IspD/TarI family cytidylyltransferase, partial [Terriglobales bacterium]